jgi:hypothetical protein
MADTARGAILTDRHRRRQVAFATASDSRIRRTWRLLDLADIDGTRAVWNATTVNEIAGRYMVSRHLAEQYLAAYRTVELGAVTGGTVLPGFDRATWSAVLDAVGPQALKRQIRAGVPARLAYETVRGQVVAEARKMIMSGGRGTVRESARQDSRAVGWRRVSDGDPCTFCAMLVSRGPAYTSEALALTKGATDDPYHRNCGCTVEVIYGDWQPTEAEQVFVDAYFDAAEAADAADEPRTAGTVLWRMREGGTFTDSPARRAIERAARP